MCFLNTDVESDYRAKSHFWLLVARRHTSNAEQSKGNISRSKPSRPWLNSRSILFSLVAIFTPKLLRCVNMKGHNSCSVWNESEYSQATPLLEFWPRYQRMICMHGRYFDVKGTNLLGFIAAPPFIMHRLIVYGTYCIQNDTVILMSSCHEIHSA
jgi:hypothetical protein